jgi:hypothetical protein
MPDGSFTLVFRYTPVGGNPDGSEDVYVPARASVACPELGFNATTDILFYPSGVVPVESWESIKCTLAFQGTLGNEPGAVIGRVFTAGELLFNEEWDNGLYGNHAWEFSADDINIDNGTSTKTVTDGHLVMECIRNADSTKARFNDFWIDFTTNGSDGLVITPNTYLQFMINEMSTTSPDPALASHTVIFSFNDQRMLQFSDEGPFLEGNENTISLKFVPGQIVNTNLFMWFQSQGIQIPDPFYLKDICVLQQVYNSTGEYHLRMDMDAIRLIELSDE